LSEIVDREELVARAQVIAANISTARRELVMIVRKLYDENADRPLDDALAFEEAELQRWRENQRLRHHAAPSGREEQNDR
jgi:hypothetical protein